MSSTVPRFSAVVLLLAAAGTLSVPATPAQGQGYDTALFEALQWENVGPARGGRSIGVAGSAARPNEYYFGATGGGLWKTTDGGQTWRPVTDGQISSASVGAVAVCEADPDVVYIGTGETQLRGNIQQGDGVYKSTDGGRTWSHVGLKETQNVARIRVHPDDCGTAWVAGFGVHSAANPERGVYKTTDGGESWDLVLHESSEAGAVDISVHPGNPDLIFAATWEAWRKSWGMSSGGPGSKLWKSTDGGESWTEITRNPGLPQEGLIGKIGVAVSPVNADRVWAIVEHDAEGGVYRSDDGGATWAYTNDERKLRQRAFYYTRIYADPQEEDVVYVLNTAFYKSEDAGETFPTTFRVPHGDNHDLWIAPDDNQRMINSNDGGGNVSVNGGRTWTDQDFATAQFYRVITTEHFPYMICGAQQDNSTACMPHKGWGHLNARGFGSGNYFFSVGGCESGYIAPHPENTDVYFAGCYGGSLSRYDHATGATRAVNVWPENPMGQSSEDLIERVQWTFPIVFDRHDSDILYTGTQKVWRTRNEGQSWEQISPDLTRADPMTVGPSGGPITRDQTGVETYATVFAIAPSHHDADVIWAGSDDGLVHVTRNASSSQPDWANVTPPDAPDFVRINTVEASPTTPGKAYVSGIRYLVDNDRAPYIWKTEDYGATWTKIVNGLPGDDFIRAIREDPMRAGLLYAASERTVYVSWDDGANWQPLTMNLPTVQVSDLVVEDNDLVIGTHGRSFWVMYNIQPLREMNDDIAGADVHLFKPVDVYRGIDNTVEVIYNLKEGAQSVTLEFMDPQGEVVASFTGEPRDEEEEGEEAGGGFFGFGGGARSPAVEAGSHSFRWNMRYPAWTDFDGRIFWAAGPVGPMALPGPYQVQLTVDGEEPLVRSFEIRVDPRLDGVTLEDLRERFRFAMEIRDRVSEANEAVIEIRRVKGDVDDRLDQTDNAEIETVGGQVKENLSEVEGEIYQVRNRSNQDPLNFPIKLNNKLAALLNLVEGSESAPTDQSYEVYGHLSGLLQQELDRMIIILQQDLARLNELLREEGLDPIEVGNLIS
jgi:photosystem II stability/assembly factor-like uncharacterized protein